MEFYGLSSEQKLKSNFQKYKELHEECQDLRKHVVKGMHEVSFYFCTGTLCNKCAEVKKSLDVDPEKVLEPLAHNGYRITGDFQNIANYIKKYNDFYVYYVYMFIRGL